MTTSPRLFGNHNQQEVTHESRLSAWQHQELEGRMYTPGRRDARRHPLPHLLRDGRGAGLYHGEERHGVVFPAAPVEDAGRAGGSNRGRPSPTRWLDHERHQRGARARGAWLKRTFAYTVRVLERAAEKECKEEAGPEGGK